MEKQTVICSLQQNCCSPWDHDVITAWKSRRGTINAVRGLICSKSRETFSLIGQQRPASRLERLPQDLHRREANLISPFLFSCCLSRIRSLLFFEELKKKKQLDAKPNLTEERLKGTLSAVAAVWQHWRSGSLTSSVLGTCSDSTCKFSKCKKMRQPGLWYTLAALFFTLYGFSHVPFSLYWKHTGTACYYFYLCRFL